MNQVPMHDPEVLVQAMDEDLVLLHARTEAYYSLDEVGARVWQLIDGYRSVAAILAILQSEYAVDPTVLRTDLEELLADLLASGLVAWTSE